MADPLRLQIQLEPVVDKITAPFKYFKQNIQALASTLNRAQQSSADISSYHKLRLQLRLVSDEAEKMRAKFKHLSQKESEQRDRLKALNQERNRVLKQANKYAKELERCKTPNEALRKLHIDHKISLTKLGGDGTRHQTRMEYHATDSWKFY